MPVLLILLVPVLIRLPAWLLGFRESPIWIESNLTLPGPGGLLPGLPGFLDPNAGWTTQALGGLAAQQWLAGQVPWWDPFTGLGMPLAAEMQSSALFLPYILLLALPGGFVLLNISLQWTAGIATWLLLRRLGLRQCAAVTGGLLFELCASFAWMGPPASLPVAFLPLFLLGIENAREAAIGRQFRGWRLAAVAVALSLYAGFPETAYLDGLLALVWAGFRLATTPGHRAGFAGRVAAGGIVGLLLAAPALWPFFGVLPLSNLGSREGFHMAAIALSRESLVQLLAPYALGLPAAFNGSDPSGLMPHLWGRVGGYCGMGLALAAILGVLGPGPNRGLRWVLCAWAALMLGRIAGVPGFSALLGVMPFHDDIQVFRYAGATWLLPCCILAAHAVDVPAARWRVWAASLVLAGAAAAGAALAWWLVRQIHGAPSYLAASLGWAAISVAGVAAAFHSRGRWMIAAALVADSALLFVVPLAAGPRHPALDRAAISFLKDNLGLQRFASLGPIMPNYGALFGLATVNHSYLPVPAIWADYVTAHLDPRANPVLFTGIFPPNQPGEPTNAQLMAARMPAYAALGVRYILAPPGPNPFGPASAAPGLRDPVALFPGQSLSGHFAGGAVGIDAIAVTVGTYGGHSTGTLAATVCARETCTRGGAGLEDAADNQPLVIKLDRPLTHEGLLTWTLELTASNHPVAIWRSASAPGETLLVLPIDLPGQGDLAAVYADRLMTIYAVPDPAPYFSSTGGPCTLTVQTRLQLTAICDAPATLIRRELAFPGWTADVNGARQIPSSEFLPFQTVTLGAGSAAVRFSYRPSGYASFSSLFAAGLLGLIPWPFRRKR